MSAPGARMLASWTRLAGWPGGKWLFSRLLGRMVPYTGSIGARVETLEPGHAVVMLRDRRVVRNHLDSIHAIALANLGEVSSGLATMTALPPGVRSILTGLSVTYLKKARGTLTAESRVSVPDTITTPVDFEVEAVIRDAVGDPVTRVEARWRLSPPRA